MRPSSRRTSRLAGVGPGCVRCGRTTASLGGARKRRGVGVWGFGWTGPYSAHLVVNTELGTATVYQDNGSAVVFYKSGETYAAGLWVEATLVKEGTNYIYMLSDQAKLEFNAEGRLAKETDRNGNSVTLTYNAEKRLEKA